MAIDKFLHLISSSSLWFSRCDYFEDGWEGHYSDATYDTFSKSSKRPEAETQNSWGWIQNLNHVCRNYLHINCWHINEDESAALWQIHSTSGKSVAIKTSVGRLRDAIADTDMSIYGGRVRYLDYAKEVMPMENIFTPYLRKRRSFFFENELRLIYWNSALMPSGENMAETDLPAGVAVPVKLDSLIETVYISPQADRYLHDALTVLLEKFGLSAKIVQSNLFAAPK